MTLAAIALIAGASWTLGRLALSRTSWPEIARVESIALTLAAGLGLTALLLSMLALAGRFDFSTPALVVLSAGACVDVIRRRGEAPFSAVSVKLRGLPLAIVIVAAIACLGALAPVTDDDALAFVIPSAQHIADTGTLRVWSDQARSMFPESEAVLTAFVIRAGGDRLGAVTAFEWLLAIGVISALARIACAKAEHVSAAIVIAIGAPVVAFQVASAKEDLLLLTSAAAAAFCLARGRSLADYAAAGLFAGLAAGAKYPGLGVAIGAVAWALIRRPRWSAIVAGCAIVGGGFWYALNLWRFGNPVAPFILGAQGTSFDAQLVRDYYINTAPRARNVVTLLSTPFWIFLDSASHGGRGNLFNPLAYAGMAGLFAAGARRRSGALFFVAAVLYAGWFFNLQNARLLLPAVVMLTPAAADLLVPIYSRNRALRAVAFAAAAMSLGVVAAVGLVRFERYARDPSTYLSRESQHYDDIAWMNQHLDPARDRVATTFKVTGYLRIPSLVLDPTRQLEIGAGDLTTPDRLLAACRRQGITHLFGTPEDFTALAPHLRLLRANPASRLGGVRFFREPPVEATAVYAVAR